MSKSEYKNSIESKRKIGASYLSLLSKNPTGKITVTQVVKHARLNRGTFYLHFKNIEDISKHIEDDLAKNFKSMEQEFRQCDIDKTPEVLLNKINEILTQDLAYYKLIVTVKENGTLMNKIKNALLNSISNNFKIMKYVTSFTKFKMVVQFVTGGVIANYTDWFKGCLDCTLEELTQFSAIIIREGLRGGLRY